MKQLIICVAAAVAAAAAHPALSCDEKPDSRWSITAALPTPDYYGATVANGNIGITVAGQPLRNERIILAGTFDRTAHNDVIRLLEGYNMLDMTIKVNGKPVSSADITDFTQTLNLRNSSMDCAFTVPGQLHVSYRTLAVGGMAGSAMTTVTLRPLSDITVQVSNNLTTPAGMRHINGTRQRFISAGGKEIDMLSASSATPMGRMTVGAASGFVFDDRDDAKITRLTPEPASPDSATDMTQSFEVTLRRGEPFTFTLAAATVNSASASVPQNAAERAVCSLQLEGTGPAMKRHRRYWDTMWQGDIEIDGPDTDQQDIRYMIYSIYSSIEPDASASPSPFGLSTTGYSGHVFWDTDLWMYPPMLILNPAIARSMSDYRADRLEGAMRNHRNSGGRALYPWESADEGMEETPLSATTGIQEIHVSACIALALWQRYLVEKDTTWLRDKAFPVLKATADFWVERADREDDGRHHIRNVVGADEFAENVDDNAFTNAAAKKNLSVAAQASRMLGLQPDPRWEETARTLAFHQIPGGITAEYRGFDGATAKQADVNLLAYPLDEITDPAQIERDLSYYTGIIDLATTPAMTEAIFSILYTRLGQWDNAHRYFRQSYKPNQFGPFRGISECKGGRSPYFITGAGGALQAILMGYAGLEITTDGIRRRPASAPAQLPPGWRSITVHIPGQPSVTIR